MNSVVTANNRIKSYVFNNTNLFKLLDVNQKKALFILSLGTFLEYFDLMLYLHMSIFLNDLFFPKVSPYSHKLISATGFCSVFVFRPLGALLFGYLGDLYGRKSTIILTTTMMAGCCIAMVFIPTYEQIGITAAWLVTICRIVQGLSSMGEVIGAQIYISETIKKPLSYPATNLIGCSCVVGSLASLGISTLILNHGFEWRIAFLMGAFIAVVGSFARTTLRETPEFANARLKLKNILENSDIQHKVVLSNDPIVNPKVNNKTSISYFLLQCGRPICLYFLYVYCAYILQEKFNFSSAMVIQHNLKISLTEFIAMLINTYLSCRFCPLKIIRVRTRIFLMFFMFIPYCLIKVTSPFQLYLVQMMVALFQPTSSPAEAILFTSFPVFKRFSYITFLYALCRASIFILTSFGFVYLYEKFNHWGILLIFVPLMFAYKFSLDHFDKLERDSGVCGMNTNQTRMV